MSMYVRYNAGDLLMTGKEYLLDKTEEEIYDLMKWLFYDYGLRYTNSRIAIIEWLKDNNYELPTDKKKVIYQGKVIEV